MNWEDAEILTQSLEDPVLGDDDDDDYYEILPQCV